MKFIENVILFLENAQLFGHCPSNKLVCIILIASFFIFHDIS